MRSWPPEGKGFLQVLLPEDLFQWWAARPPQDLIDALTFARKGIERHEELLRIISVDEEDETDARQDDH